MEYHCDCHQGFERFRPIRHDHTDRRSNLLMNFNRFCLDSRKYVAYQHAPSNYDRSSQGNPTSSPVASHSAHESGLMQISFLYFLSLLKSC